MQTLTLLMQTAMHCYLPTVIYNEHTFFSEGTPLFSRLGVANRQLALVILRYVH